MLSLDLILIGSVSKHGLNGVHQRLALKQVTK